MNFFHPIYFFSIRHAYPLDTYIVIDMYIKRASDIDLTTVVKNCAVPNTKNVNLKSKNDRVRIGNSFLTFTRRTYEYQTNLNEKRSKHFCGFCLVNDWLLDAFKESKLNFYPLRILIP